MNAYSEMKNRLAMFFLTGVLLVGVSANAVLYDLTRITDNGKSLTFEEGDFTMDITPYGGGALIVFSNHYPKDSVITKICFLDNELIEFSDFASPPISSEWISFSVDSKNAMLPAGNPYGFTPHTTFGFDADPAGPKNGLHPGESLGLLFDLTDGTTYDRVIRGFNELTLRSGIHVQALPGDESESFISTPIPEPATLALVGFGALLIRHKKRGTAQ